MNMAVCIRIKFDVHISMSSRSSFNRIMNDLIDLFHILDEETDRLRDFLRMLISDYQNRAPIGVWIVQTHNRDAALHVSTSVNEHRDNLDKRLGVPIRL